MNFTSARPKVNEAWTTSLYLSPPISDVTRLSPTKIDRGAELALYFGWIGPPRFGRNGEPGADRTLRLRVTRPEFPQGLAGDHLHGERLLCHQFGDMAIMTAMRPTVRSLAHTFDATLHGVTQQTVAGESGAIHSCQVSLDRARSPESPQARRSAPVALSCGANSRSRPQALDRNTRSV
jgi:hypothetical protein